MRSWVIGLRSNPNGCHTLGTRPDYHVTAQPLVDIPRLFDGRLAPLGDGRFYRGCCRLRGIQRSNAVMLVPARAGESDGVTYRTRSLTYLTISNETGITARPVRAARGG